jgi:hypothetical protein
MGDFSLKEHILEFAKELKPTLPEEATEAAK